jgi:hypothetical protein
MRVVARPTPGIARDPEAGTGIIGSVAAVSAFLLLLLAAVQVSVARSARSSVSAAGFDSARAVAARQVDHRDPVALATVERAAQERFARVVGPAGDDARFDWQVDQDAVHLRVRMTAPHVLPDRLAGALGALEIDRTFTARIETVR